MSLIFYVNFLFFSDAFSVLVVFFKKATKKLLLLQNNMKLEGEFIEIRAHGVVCHDFLGFFWHYYVPHCEFCNSSKQRQRAVIAPKIRLTCLHCITIAPTKLLSALLPAIAAVIEMVPFTSTPCLSWLSSFLTTVLLCTTNVTKEMTKNRGWP